MYIVYNDILRQFGQTFNYFNEKRNKFPTTIFVLVSAVIKIIRVTKIPPGLKLYRGLSADRKLPDGFWKADKNGCRGYMEWGFMSTTSNYETAIQYSGAKEGKPGPLPMVIQAYSASIDRGGCIKDLSQYPGEVLCECRLACTPQFLCGPCSVHP